MLRARPARSSSIVDMPSIIPRRMAIASSLWGTKNIIFSFFLGDRTRHCSGRGGRSLSFARSGSSRLVLRTRNVRSPTNSPSDVPRKIFTSRHVRNFLWGMLFLFLGDPGRIAQTRPMHQARWCISASSMVLVADISRSISCDSSASPMWELFISPYRDMSCFFTANRRASVMLWNRTPHGGGASCLRQYDRFSWNNNPERKLVSDW